MSAHEMYLTHNSGLANISVRGRFFNNLMADVERSADGTLNIPDILPFSIRGESHKLDLLWKQKKLGVVTVLHKNNTLVIAAEIDDAIPESTQSKITERLRPFLMTVLGEVEKIAILSRTIMGELTDLVGVPDHDRVRAPYEGAVTDVYSLLHPQIFTRVLGPNFRNRYEAVNFKTSLVKVSYESEGMELPVFNMEVPTHYGRLMGVNEVHILGTGNREKARLRFVSESIRQAVEMSQSMLMSPEFVADMAAMRASFNHDKLGHADNIIHYLGENDRSSSGHFGFGEEDDHEVDMGHGFRALFERDTEFRDGDMLVFHGDDLIVSCLAGKIHGISSQDALGLLKRGLLIGFRQGISIPSDNWLFLDWEEIANADKIINGDQDYTDLINYLG